MNAKEFLEGLFTEDRTEAHRTTCELIEELKQDPNFHRIAVVLERLHHEVNRKQDSDWGR